MNRTVLLAGKAGLLFSGAFAAALIGCTTHIHHYHNQPPPEEPPPPPQVEEEVPCTEIRTVADFSVPLSFYGSWEVIGTYGRCWRPFRVDPGWRPYCNGNWVRCDAGWYWASDEPWAWATYHYGRWDFSVQFGWFWVPLTQWAPAWVSWHQGNGYIAWAPLSPSTRISRSGVVEVEVRSLSPRAYIVVEERRFLEPVRPTTVVTSNTVIEKTTNITKVKVVNQTVINEGPRPEVIERASGRRLQTSSTRELRHRQEEEVAARHRKSSQGGGKKEGREKRDPVASPAARGGAGIPGIQATAPPAAPPAEDPPSSAAEQAAPAAEKEAPAAEHPEHPEQPEAPAAAEKAGSPADSEAPAAKAEAKKKKSGKSTGKGKKLGKKAKKKAQAGKEEKQEEPAKAEK